MNLLDSIKLELEMKMSGRDIYLTSKDCKDFCKDRAIVVGIVDKDTRDVFFNGAINGETFLHKDKISFSKEKLQEIHLCPHCDYTIDIDTLYDNTIHLEEGKLNCNFEHKILSVKEEGYHSAIVFVTYLWLLK